VDRHSEPAGIQRSTAPTDGIANGVYQDFSNFVRTYPYSWTDVRASRVNHVDGGIYKNFQFRESLKLQYRFECYNAFNHARFPAPDSNPANSTFGQVAKTEVNQARGADVVEAVLLISSSSASALCNLAGSGRATGRAPA
jgi:hypothetical protein